MRMTAKELIAEARATAPTLPPAAAKLMTAMADRLDLQFVVLCESRNEAKQLAAENAALKNVFGPGDAVLNFLTIALRHTTYDQIDLDDVTLAFKMSLPETLATDAVLASLRAEGVDMAIEHLHNKFEGTGHIGVPVMALEWLAAQLRSKSVSPAGVEQPPAYPAMTPLPVERNQYGYWTHPIYEEFCDGREYISNEEFNVWMKDNGLEWEVDYRDEEALDPEVDGYDLSTWQPEAPAGEGWFVGSIHDTDDGAVCIWLRNKAGE